MVDNIRYYNFDNTIGIVFKYNKKKKRKIKKETD